MNAMRLIMVWACFCLSIVPIMGQEMEPNLKFGKPTNQELAMTVYEPDPDASAVVLCSLTQTYYEVRNNSFKVITDVKTRIKILKEEGLDNANITVPYEERESGTRMKEVITGVKATAYNMENGEVTKSKMTNDMVFREKYSKDIKLLKFTVPQTKVGTVIEYLYTKESDFYYSIDTWYAQRSIPVVYASYKLVIPEYFKFNVAETGANPTERKIESGAINFNVSGSLLHCSSDEYHFIARNLPALKSDKFVWNASDFSNKVEAEFRSFEVPGLFYENYTASWSDIDEQLMSDSEFGGCCKRSNPLKQEMQAAGIASMGDVREKVAASFALLRQKLPWNGKYAFWGKSASQVLKEGTANNADFNFILINMLSDVGVTAYPVVLSTRDHGRIPFSHPTIKNLNTFVVGVLENDSTMSFIDASAEQGYINVLPPKLLVEQARVVIPKSEGFWVNLQEMPRAETTIRAMVKLSSDGSFEGNAKIKYERLAALMMREEYRDAADSSAYVSELGKTVGAQVDGYSQTGRDQFTPLVEETITFSGKADATADHIYVNPFLFRPLKEALFKAEKRNLPVEFPYKQQVTVSLLFQLPEGYAVEEMPQGTSMTTKDGGLSYTVRMNPSPQIVAVKFTFTIDNLLYSQLDYSNIKTFFENMAATFSEMLVLKKNG